MKRKLSWQLYSSDDRNKVINLIKQAIDDIDGCILNFNLFSDLDLTLRVEVGAHMIEPLHNSLSQIVNIASLEDQYVNLSSEREWTIFINISFRSGRGTLKQEIPEVNG